MLGLDTRTTWILIAWLLPVWWATALLVLAFLAKVSPSWRVFVSRVFDRLGKTPAPV